MDAEKLVKVYIKMRDAKAALEKEIANIESQMDVVAQDLLEICKQTGQSGGKTQYGTFTRTVKSRYDTTDWGSFYSFVREHDAPELLEKRIHQTNMKQFLEENPDVLPAGLNVVSKYSVSVRRA